MTTQENIVDIWRGLSIVDDSAEAVKVQFYVSCWNWLTAPWDPRDDREHRICRKLANRVRRLLDGRYGWSELESGRLTTILKG